MRKLSLLGAALLAVFAGCNRSGYVDATPGGGQRVAKSTPPARIARGQQVNLRDYLEPGKTVIFDFTSEYCPPCRAIAPSLHKLHATRADVTVVEVDINRPGVTGIDWDSPVARQYELNSIPHFKVFGPDGRLQAEGNDARALVAGWFD
jgi:thiol-disulfide isomerase/thioredoxin